MIAIRNVLLVSLLAGSMTIAQDVKSASDVFLLRIHAQDKGTVNQAVVPQTIRQPYWRTDLDVAVVPDTGHQLYCALAYPS